MRGMEATETKKDNAGSVFSAHNKSVSFGIGLAGPHALRPKKKPISFGNKVSLKDKIIFTEQLEVMVRAGLSIGEALQSLAEETENKYFAGVLEEIIADVEGGSPLSLAFSKHPKIFNEIYINLITSGERSGKIDSVLGRISSQLQKDYELTRKVKGALSYPIFVMCALIAVMVLVLVFIMPQLKAIFDDAGVPLPALTRFVLGASSFLQHFGLYIFLAVIGVIVGASRWQRTASGKKFFDSIIILIPVIGSLLKKSYMARFARTLSSLLSSGLPVLDALTVTSNVVGNVLYKEEIMRFSSEIKSGVPMSKVLKSSKRFPGIVGALAKVGEKSGSLDEVFDTLADFFDRDVENITSNLSALLEPLIMIVMGVGIGGLIISVLQPIYGLVNAI